MLQKLWELKIDRDESVPQDIYSIWDKFREKLVMINNIKFQGRLQILAILIYNYTVFVTQVKMHTVVACSFELRIRIENI